MHIINCFYSLCKKKKKIEYSAKHYPRKVDYNDKSEPQALLCQSLEFTKDLR